MKNNEIVNPTHPGKLELIEAVGRAIDGPWRFVDLGGLWAVHGAYAFHALSQSGCVGGTMVDTHPTRTFLDALAHEPRLEFIQGNFGDAEVFDRLPPFDVVFLFDTLLHQVRPDWDEILRMYAARASHILIFNQQYTGERTVRLLDLGENEYFRNVPHDRGHPTYAELFRRLDDPHPVHGRPWRDVHHIWQWGITDPDLAAALQALGFAPVFSHNWGQVLQLENFENHAFIFARTSPVPDRPETPATRDAGRGAMPPAAPPASTLSEALPPAPLPAPGELPPVSEIRYAGTLEGMPPADLLTLLRSFRRALCPGGRLYLDLPADAAARQVLAERARYAGFSVSPEHADQLALTLRDRRIASGALPLVTLAIPAFKPAFFAACLDSALAQTYPNLHILVCDDSADGHLRRIADAVVIPPGRMIEWIRNPHNIGGRANFAQCIERANGEFVKFLCDDDMLTPDCIERMVEAFRREPAATLVFSRRTRIDSAGDPLPDDQHTEALSAVDCVFRGEELAGAIMALQANFIGEPTTVMFRKVDLAWIQPHYASFDGHDDIRVVGDIAAWHNLLSQGEAAYVAAPLSRFRIHPGQNQAQDEIRALIGTSWAKLDQGSRTLGFLHVPHPSVAYRQAGGTTWLIDAELPINRRLAARCAATGGDTVRRPDRSELPQAVIGLIDGFHEAPPENPPPARHSDSDFDRYRHAAAAMAAGGLEKGAAALIALAGEDTSLWEVYADLAEYALQQNDIEAALTLLQTATNKASAPGRAALGLATLLAETGCFEDALVTLSPYLRYHPQDVGALSLVRRILGLAAELSPVAWARLLADLRHEEAVLGTRLGLA